MSDLLFLRAPLFIAVIFASVPSLSTGADDVTDVPVALIVKISGPATLHKPGQDKVILNETRDKSRLLYSNEIITCGMGAQVHIRIDQSLVAPGTPTDCHAGSTISLPPLAANIARKQSAYVSLKDYSRAGRDKGPESAIFYPANKGAITLDAFTIRWRVRPPLSAVTVVLRDAGGAELARVTGVDGGSGKLDSPVLREALVTYRASRRATYDAFLVLHPESGPEQTVNFTILSAQQESDLAKALATVSSETGIFGHIERAAVFDLVHMYNSVAAEYDEALKEAPGSLTLLRASLNAYSKIGDLQRARGLRDKIQELDSGDGN